MKVGIIGAGSIAVSMARTIAGMRDVENYAIGSRDLGKAKEFAARNRIQKAYGSYEELLADPAVDLVYIALPHSHHCEWTIKALEAGRHVLCEKAFSVNEYEAREMIRVSREKGLLLAEAIWTRYMPSRAMIADAIGSGAIGELKTVSANLGYRISQINRLIAPELAGGCLLDLTVYPLNFASMVWGDDIKRIAANCVYTDTGVDGQDSVMIEYNDGRMASLFTTMYGLTDRRGIIYGTKGRIEVQNINNPEKITVYSQGTEASGVREYSVPPQITGYEYEVLACKRAIEDGRTECVEMPHSQTIEIMRQMDEIRSQFGIRYPMER
ncbi:MAG: Gfo/Idh/MocA family oxidoreductase [Lachnospiraceae bacterium]|nr:Gfo/Idh/MocA family oxidoreductase [Lachnospiraceae bacterium]